MAFTLCIILFLTISEQKVNTQNTLQIPISKTFKKRESSVISQQIYGGERRFLDEKQAVFLKNYQEIQYYGTLFLGTPPQNRTFIFDTGSSWLWIPTDQCSSDQCPNKHFNEEESSTYVVSSKNVTVQYGIGIIQGYESNETISLDKNQAISVQNFTFLSVYQALQIQDMISDGLVGLAPRKIGSNTNQDLLIESLYGQGKIQHKIFSFFIGNQSEQSLLWIGGYVEPVGGNITWLQIDVASHWQVPLSGLIINGMPIILSTKKAILDTGSSVVYVPSSDYAYLYSAITTGKNCSYDTDSSLYCRCTSANDPSYPNITIVLGQGNNFVLRPKDYFVQYGKDCWVLFQKESQSTTSYWILGDNFLRAYYSIYDMQNQLIGLASADFVRNNSYITPSYSINQVPSSVTSYRMGFKTMYIYLIIGICVGLLLITGLILLIRCIHQQILFKRQKQFVAQQQQAMNENVEQQRAELQEMHDLQVALEASKQQPQIALPEPQQYPQHQQQDNINQAIQESIKEQQLNANIRNQEEIILEQVKQQSIIEEKKRQQQQEQMIKNLNIYQ